MNKSDRKRVLLVSACGLERGGVQAFHYNWIKYTPAGKYEYTWFFPYELTVTDHKYADEFKKMGVELISGGLACGTSSIKLIPVVFKRVLKLCRKNSYDILHISTGGVPLTAAVTFAAKLAGIRTIVAYSANWFIERSKIKRLINTVCRGVIKRSATKYTACSVKAAEYMFTSADKALVINPCTDCKKYIFDDISRKKTRQEYGLTDNFVIGNMANFVGYKNHKFLVEIFGEISKADDTARLMLIGDGPLREEITNRVNSLNLEGKVIFCGNTDRPWDYFNAMDVFVFPCVSEGVGQVAIHAQNAGLVTICSDRVPRETAVTELAEYLSLSDSPKKWAENILPYKSGYERKDMYKPIVEAGYDVSSIPRYIEEAYK